MNFIGTAIGLIEFYEKGALSLTHFPGKGIGQPTTIVGQMGRHSHRKYAVPHGMRGNGFNRVKCVDFLLLLLLLLRLSSRIKLWS